jgi:hypothetical protein
MSAEENIALMKRWYREVWSERNNNTVHEREVAIEDIFAIADKVAVRWVASATHTGNRWGSCAVR